ncbi:MAG: PQQ-binding-like beta-propeller repeat protein [Gammaproteobacteria bacterium]|nr:PQQ-binding-like beta-propeller repeat protein [Gammaproteobacteria bacterium]
MLLLALSLIALGMGYGWLSARLHWWPGSTLDQAMLAADATWQKWRPRDRYNDTNLFIASRFERSGVLRHDAARAQDGYTLYTSGHDNAAFLIDMAGRTVHEWRLPFSQAWPDPPHVRAPLADEFIYWRKALLFPNGDLLAIYEASGDTPYGYGLVKVDKDSRLLWRYAQHANHDVAVDADGRVYTLIHEFRDTPVPGSRIRELPYLEDYLVVLSPTGEELRRISITEAFRNSEYAGSLDVIGDAPDGWDAWHTNTVELPTAETLPAFPFLRAGQVVISIRNADLLAAIDIESGKVTWAMTGPWYRQHDPDLLANGHIMLFDNRGHHGPGGGARVLEIDPADARIAWRYTGSAEEPFISTGRGSQQLLANGNVLITESHQGRIFEVTRDHQIVWEYISPFRAATYPDRIAVVCWATRHAPETLHFPLSGQPSSAAVTN